MKRLLFGILWAVVLYFGVCALIGAVAGGIAGANDPQNSAQAGSQAGFNAVMACRVYVLAAAVLIGGLGAWFRILPGTRVKIAD